ncbi:uncharacterized protein LOC142226197 [Haematobia irritans]|uniref:uncharacterized protein LOC142226197 n=1 Tax=Haematobia irritans TaxID=7368 RepID=UPI003F5047F5
MKLWTIVVWCLAALEVARSYENNYPLQNSDQYNHVSTTPTYGSSPAVDYGSDRNVDNGGAKAYGDQVNNVRETVNENRQLIKEKFQEPGSLDRVSTYKDIEDNSIQQNNYGYTVGLPAYSSGSLNDTHEIFESGKSVYTTPSYNEAEHLAKESLTTKNSESVNNILVTSSNAYGGHNYSGTSAHSNVVTSTSYVNKSVKGIAGENMDVNISPHRDSQRATSYHQSRDPESYKINGVSYRRDSSIQSDNYIPSHRTSSQVTSFHKSHGSESNGVSYQRAPVELSAQSDPKMSSHHASLQVTSLYKSHGSESYKSHGVPYQRAPLDLSTQSDPKMSSHQTSSQPTSFHQLPGSESYKSDRVSYQTTMTDSTTQGDLNFSSHQSSSQAKIPGSEVYGDHSEASYNAASDKNSEPKYNSYHTANDAASFHKSVTSESYRANTVPHQGSPIVLSHDSQRNTANRPQYNSSPLPQSSYNSSFEPFFNSVRSTPSDPAYNAPSHSSLSSSQGYPNHGSPASAPYPSYSADPVYTASSSSNASFQIPAPGALNDVSIATRSSSYNYPGLTSVKESADPQYREPSSNVLSNNAPSNNESPASSATNYPSSFSASEASAASLSNGLSSRGLSDSATTSGSSPNTYSNHFQANQSERKSPSNTGPTTLLNDLTPPKSPTTSSKESSSSPLYRPSAAPSPIRRSVYTSSYQTNSFNLNSNPPIYSGFNKHLYRNPSKPNLRGPANSIVDLSNRAQRIPEGFRNHNLSPINNPEIITSINNPLKSKTSPTILNSPEASTSNSLYSPQNTPPGSAYSNEDNERFSPYSYEQSSGAENAGSLPSTSFPCNTQTSTQYHETPSTFSFPSGLSQPLVYTNGSYEVTTAGQNTLQVFSYNGFEHDKATVNLYAGETASPQNENYKVDATGESFNVPDDQSYTLNPNLLPNSVARQSRKLPNLSTGNDYTMKIAYSYGADGGSTGYKMDIAPVLNYNSIAYHAESTGTLGSNSHGRSSLTHSEVAPDPSGDHQSPYVYDSSDVAGKKVDRPSSASSSYHIPYSSSYGSNGIPKFPETRSELPILNRRLSAPELGNSGLPIIRENPQAVASDYLNEPLPYYSTPLPPFSSSVQPLSDGYENENNYRNGLAPSVVPTTPIPPSSTPAFTYGNNPGLQSYGKPITQSSSNLRSSKDSPDKVATSTLSSLREFSDPFKSLTKTPEYSNGLPEVHYNNAVSSPYGSTSSLSNDRNFNSYENPQGVTSYGPHADTATQESQSSQVLYEPSPFKVPNSPASNNYKQSYNSQQMTSYENSNSPNNENYESPESDGYIMVNGIRFPFPSSLPEKSSMESHSEYGTSGIYDTSQNSISKQGPMYLATQTYPVVLHPSPFMSGIPHPESLSVDVPTATSYNPEIILRYPMSYGIPLKPNGNFIAAPIPGSYSQQFPGRETNQINGVYETTAYQKPYDFFYNRPSTSENSRRRYPRSLLGQSRSGIGSLVSSDSFPAGIYLVPNEQYVL